jgi:methylmalonyl-CoA mutase N-terminal domain/subunit
VVGVNRFRDEGADEQGVELLTVPEEVRTRQLEQLAAVRASRDEAAAEAALEGVRRAAASGENTMPAILAAVRASATVGEISAALGDVFGYHRASTSL